MAKELKEIIKRTYAVCGRKISVRIYKNPTGKSCNYRGGHYFGKIPLYTKQELTKTLKIGARKERIGNLIVEVLTKILSPINTRNAGNALNVIGDIKNKFKL